MLSSDDRCAKERRAARVNAIRKRRSCMLRVRVSTRVCACKCDSGPEPTVPLGGVVGGGGGQEGPAQRSSASMGCEPVPSIGAQTRTWAEVNVGPRPLVVTKQAQDETRQDSERQCQRPPCAFQKAHTYDTHRNTHRQNKTETDKQRHTHKQTETQRQTILTATPIKGRPAGV